VANILIYYVRQWPTYIVRLIVKGKSVIFGAWKEFYEITGHPERLRLTAPTGVVASDIGGCTIHSEASLRISPAKMKSTPALRTNLEERISPLETLILDEERAQ
jgi:hypothetical protein